MRSYDANDDYDVKCAAEINAEPWQIDLLALNPDYVCWGVGEDCMTTTSGGRWGSTVVEGWTPRSLDDLNEVVNFYFSLARPSKRCTTCNGDGGSPEYRKLSEDWYGFGSAPAWKCNITDDEAAALVEKGRFPAGSTADSVNAAARQAAFTHDSLNQWICVDARCKRLGLPTMCGDCDGRGHHWISDTCRVDLTMWLLFPRKGAAPGLRVEGIKRDDLPSVFAFLRSAAERNAARFAKVPAGGAS